MLFVFAVMLGGCINEPGQDGGVNESEVSVMPRQLYLDEGGSASFSYHGHNISVEFWVVDGLRRVRITLDGVEKTVERNASAVGGVFWRTGGLGFAVKPVIWEVREGRDTPIYEKTWNVSQVYIEISP